MATLEVIRKDEQHVGKIGCYAKARLETAPLWRDRLMGRNILIGILWLSLLFGLSLYVKFQVELFADQGKLGDILFSTTFLILGAIIARFGLARKRRELAIASLFLVSLMAFLLLRGQWTNITLHFLAFGTAFGLESRRMMGLSK